MNNLKEKMTQECTRRIKHHMDAIKSQIEDLEYNVKQYDILSDIVTKMNSCHIALYREIAKLEFQMW